MKISRTITFVYPSKTAFAVTAAIALLSSISLLTPSSSRADNPAPSKQQIELEKKQLDLEKAKVELERSKTELEAARLALQATETKEQLTMQLQGDVAFDMGEATLRPEARESLNKVAIVLSQFPDSEVVIRGYTDAIGDAKANLKLSKQRADAVRDWLVKQANIDENNITTKGLGEADPVADNKNLNGSDNPEGRKKNRRVEISVMKGELAPTDPAASPSSAAETVTQPPKATAVIR